MLTASHITTALCATNAQVDRPSDWRFAGARGVGGAAARKQSDARLGDLGPSFGRVPGSKLGRSIDMPRGVSRFAGVSKSASAGTNDRMYGNSRLKPD